MFEEALVLDRPDVKVSLLDEYDGRAVRAAADIILEVGAPILWFVFPGAWHDVGRFHLADGTFTGWYTNLCTPVEINGPRWACTDLFLDLWQPAGTPDALWLDDDEFQAAVDDGLLGPAVAERTRRERQDVSARVERGQWPPLITREIDLHRARELIAAD